MLINPSIFNLTIEQTCGGKYALQASKSGCLPTLSVTMYRHMNRQEYCAEIYISKGPHAHLNSIQHSKTQPPSQLDDLLHRKSRDNTDVDMATGLECSLLVHRKF